MYTYSESFDNSDIIIDWGDGTISELSSEHSYPDLSDK
jgi:hypothetical protein